MNRKGFSFIELIATLLLVGILVVSATIPLVSATQALLQVRTNSRSVQKAQFAMVRMTREFNTITNIVSGASDAITYDFLNSLGVAVRRTIDWDGAPGDPLLLDNVPLSDDVASFELRYYDGPDAAADTTWSADSRIIEVNLQSLGTGDLYTNRIAPRNI